MKMTNIFSRFFNKRNKHDWASLSDNQKKLVVHRLRKQLFNMAGPQYKLIQSNDKNNRESPQAETQNEDEILTQHRRNQILDMMRNQIRNSATFNAMIRQIELQAIGTEGGKVVLSYDDMESVNDLRFSFYDWTRNAEFFDGLSLNLLLKVIYKTYVLGGDCVLVFDDGLVEDSGKVICVESDCIMNTTPEALA